jgi:hypothetical protein
MTSADFVRPRNVSTKMASDTGMVSALLLLLLGLWSGKTLPFQLAVPVLVLAMVAPFSFRYLAVLWFGLSHVLGTFSSRVVLTVLFFVLVVPVGLWRRARGKDALRLRAWRRDQKSLFLARNKRFTADDLQHPF